MITTVRLTPGVQLPIILIFHGFLFASGCAGEDHLTETLVHVGGTSSGTLIGTTLAGGTSIANTGGNTAGTTGPLASSGNSSKGTTRLDWSANSYDPAGGATITYQGHFNGTACFATCHSHRFTVGGTVYSADGRTAANNVEIGILVGGSLITSYSGSGGNFYFSVPSSADWASATIAVRTATSSNEMPINSGASGNCNSCHNSSRRIRIQ